MRQSWKHCTNLIDSLDEMGKLLEKYNLPKLIHSMKENHK